MKPVLRHDWDIDYHKAVSIQNKLRQKLTLRNNLSPKGLIAGVDVSYSRGDPRCYAAVVLMNFPAGEVIETALAQNTMTFPYIPGLLTFREGPVVIKALGKLKHRPKILIFDGQGIAHPRGFGLASHLGVLFDCPSVGCAKSILVGEHEDLGQEKGATAPLIHDGKRVGTALRTRNNIKPVYVSPGHKITQQAAVQTIQATCRGYRLPEPTRLAHLAVNKYRKEQS